MTHFGSSKFLLYVVSVPNGSQVGVDITGSGSKGMIYNEKKYENNSGGITQLYPSYSGTHQGLFIYTLHT